MDKLNEQTDRIKSIMARITEGVFDTIYYDDGSAYSHRTKPVKHSNIDYDDRDVEPDYFGDDEEEELDDFPDEIPNDEDEILDEEDFVGDMSLYPDLKHDDETPPKVKFKKTNREKKMEGSPSVDPNKYYKLAQSLYGKLDVGSVYKKDNPHFTPKPPDFNERHKQFYK